MCPPSLTTQPPQNTRSKGKGAPPAAQDPWQDWQPLWEHPAADSHPYRLQERHAPTTPVTLRASAQREEYVCQRRIVDARLWDALPREAQDAALDIAFAYEALTKGLGAATSNWNKTPSARNPCGAANTYGRLSGDYMDWARLCQREGISHSMIIDILCLGITCQALDRDRRVRSGTSRQNLYDGLMLYARLRGWIGRKNAR